MSAFAKQKWITAAVCFLFLQTLSIPVQASSELPPPMIDCHKAQAAAANVVARANAPQTIANTDANVETQVAPHEETAGNDGKGQTPTESVPNETKKNEVKEAVAQVAPVEDRKTESKSEAKGKEQTIPQVPAGWRADENNHNPFTWELPNDIPLDKATLPLLFYRQAMKDPKRYIIADDRFGALTNQDIITRLYGFVPAIKKLEGRHIGILLPPSTTSTVATLATQIAGKVPAMLNPTVGLRDLRAAIRIAEVHSILTSREYIEELQKVIDEMNKKRDPEDRVDLKEFSDKFVILEDVVKTKKFLVNAAMGKVISKLPSHFWGLLKNAKVDPVSMVLFTSGSTSEPKGVEVLHANQISNVEGILKILPAQPEQRDSVLGFLPHFHSFGATGTIALPLITGMRTAYAPNLKKMKEVIGTAEHWGSTITMGTNTFFKFFAGMARPGQISKMRIFVAGAEKLEDDVKNALLEKGAQENGKPAAHVEEGYGLTETGPAILIGGRVVPGFDVALVQEQDDKSYKEVQDGEEGILLVRGPGVMKGYLNAEFPGATFSGKNWLDTGDIVVRDPQTKHIKILGRASVDFWKIGGEKIARAKIEAVLHEQLTPKESNNFIVMPDKTGKKIRNVLLSIKKDIPSLKVINDKLIGPGELSNMHAIDRIVFLDAFPVLGTGKLNIKELLKKANTPAQEPKPTTEKEAE